MIKIATAALGLLLAAGLILHPVTAQAYTEEQKRQAKAWLSSHGYPPTEDGAWQAYSDWLDGKWWDEFGSPDEYFGIGEGDDDEEDDGEDGEDEEDDEAPTAATQKSQGEGGSKSDAETLVDLMKAESRPAEGSAAETSAAETVSVAESTVEESPTAATQADIQDLVEAVDDNEAKRTMSMLPLAVGGIAVIAGLLVAAMVWDRRKQ